MKNIDVKVEWVIESQNIHEEGGFFAITLSPNKWNDLINLSMGKPKQYNFYKQEVVEGTLLMAIENIYESRFQTVEELEEEIEFNKTRGGLPFSKKNYLLRQKYGLISRDFRKDELAKPISLEECLSVFLKIAKIEFNEKNIISVAIEQGLITEEQTTRIFILEDLEKIVKHIKKVVSTSKDYHHAFTGGKGLFQ
ncbi:MULTISPECIES: hypothetical protein [Bacillaceae]|uniref:Uncharacterized protein n=1 Tax=Evansella alkalicola TaxID=745819 RepID=A0ABS6JSS2_9BACI|nr:MULTISPECIES: hypothetical protein [Bacillaceae]MBU9721613.1 hypothetical protein [Bacillus alkalicola]